MKIHPALTTLSRALFAVLLTAAASSSHAALLTASLGYDPQGATDSRGLSAASVSRTSTTSAAVRVNYLEQVNDLPPNHTGASHSTYMDLNSAANANGAIDASVDLRIGGHADAKSVWSDSFVNNSGAVQSYQMNIALTNMKFTTHYWPDFLTGNVFSTGFLADVLVNGVSVWQTGQTFLSNDSVYQVSKVGFDLGNGSVTSVSGYGVDFWYELSDYSGTVNLGLFNAGDTIKVEYALSSFVFWNDPYCAYECGRVSAQVADPLSIAETPRIVLANTVPNNDVPEPGAITLLSIALVGLALIQRRKQA